MAWWVNRQCGSAYCQCNDRRKEWCDKMGREGVSVPINAKTMRGRDDAGRFLPGHSIKSPGRPSKAKEAAVLAEVVGAVDEGKVASVINQLLNHQSWRAQAEGVKMYLGYTLGNPVKRIVQEQGGLASVLEELGIDPDE